MLDPLPAIAARERTTPGFARNVPTLVELDWFAAGWSDFRTSPVQSVVYGLAVFAASVAVIRGVVAVGLPSLFLPTLSGVFGGGAAAGHWSVGKEPTPAQGAVFWSGQHDRGLSSFRRAAGFRRIAAVHVCDAAAARGGSSGRSLIWQGKAQLKRAGQADGCGQVLIAVDHNRRPLPFKPQLQDRGKPIV